MASGIGLSRVGWRQQHADQPRSLPSSPKSPASSHGASSNQADASFSISAWRSWNSWEEGELASLHNQPKFAQRLAEQVTNKAGYRHFGHNGVKHKSVGFAAEQFSSGGRSDGAHRKALIQGKALVTARLLKRHFRVSSGNGNGKTSWGGVVAAFKRLDNLFDHSMQEYLVPEALSGAALEGMGRSEKIKCWLKTLFSAGRSAKFLLRLAHIFTGWCENTSAPHGFIFRCIMNLVSRNIALTSPLYKLSVFTVTGALGILVASLYHVCTTAAAGAGVATPLYILIFIGFATLSATFGLMAFITRCVAIYFIRKAKLDIEGSNELQETLTREADVQLYQIDALIKTVVYNLQQANSDKEFSAEKLLKLNQDGSQEGNAYRMLCKAMQRKTDGYQASRVGQSTLVKNSEIAELLCKAYYTNSNLNVRQTNATVRMKELRTLMGAYLNGPSTTGPENQKLIELLPWCHKKAAKRDSLQRELNYVFLRELAAIDDAFLEPDNMVGAPKNYVERVAESKQERKDLRIRCEDWCKNLNKKLLTDYFKVFASDNKHSNDESKEDKHLSAHRHHPAVIARNLHCYRLPVRILMTIPKILHSFCFNWVLAVNAQSSRGYSALIRFAYRKITGRLPSIILCTNLGRFFGGFQVALSTLGLGYLANVASATTEFAINGGGWVFSTIITGTLMAILGLVALPFVLAASALVYFGGDTFYKQQLAKPAPKASRIKDFTFTPLPAQLVAH